MGTRSSDAAIADPPKPVHDQDLQTRHDALASELALIDDALTKAGFAAMADGQSEASSPLDRVGVALALLATAQMALDSVAHVLELHGLRTEGEELQSNVNVVAGSLKAATAELETARIATEQAEAKAEAATAAAAKKPKAVKGEQPKTLRPCGPTSAPEEFSAAHLVGLIEAAETVELAFSDGAHELDDVPPMLISGDAWRVDGNGRLLLTGVDVPMYGASRDAQSFDLVGYGLFLDGSLAAYARRINGPLTVAPGSTHSLRDDVVFG